MTTSTAQITLELEKSGFPGRLKQTMEGRSIRSFAQACGLSDAVLRQYLSGRSEPTRPSLLAIARAAKVSIEWLAAGIGVMRPLSELENSKISNDQEFPKRLKKAIGNRSAHSFARSCSISDAALHQYLNGQSEPTRPVLLVMAKVANVSIGWLVSGDGTSYDEAQAVEQLAHPTSIEKQSKSNVIYIDKIRFELSTELGIRFENLIFYYMTDGSMEPEIKKNSFFAVDTTRKYVYELIPGTYVFEVNSTVLVRRLEPLSEGKYIAKACSTDYESFVVDLPNLVQGFTVMGKVIPIEVRLDQ